jgi:hypothetical protein
MKKYRHVRKIWVEFCYVDSTRRRGSCKKIRNFGAKNTNWICIGIPYCPKKEDCKSDYTQQKEQREDFRNGERKPHTLEIDKSGKYQENRTL